MNGIDFLYVNSTLSLRRGACPSGQAGLPDFKGGKSPYKEHSSTIGDFQPSLYFGWQAHPQRPSHPFRFEVTINYFLTSLRVKRKPIEKSPYKEHSYLSEEFRPLLHFGWQAHLHRSFHPYLFEVTVN
jgi:hypothetical protein